MTPHAERPGLTVLADTYPALSETFVHNEIEALRRHGHAVQVVAGRRGDADGAAGKPDAVAIEASVGRRLVALAWLTARHPWRVLADLRARGRWRAEEQPRPLRELAPVAQMVRRAGSRHLHAHFAAGAALDALRLSALLGLPYSVTVHAFDLYVTRRNLAEKVMKAAFATTGCDYTVNDLRAAVPAAADRVHRVVMGVDHGYFRRATPYAGGRRVAAVGRLVEKKGFADLIEAARLLKASGAPLEGVVILGAGPLAEQLADQIAQSGLEATVGLIGPGDSDAVRRLLESADVLAMPCVVAANGDRDSMPVVVKEALAMGVPVVASDEVGLPEVVRPQWGLLHRPGDAAELAARLDELLSRPASERALMGERGRAWVLENADVDKETARLAELIAQAVRR